MSVSLNDDLSELSVPIAKYVSKVEIENQAKEEQAPIQELEVE